MELRSLRPLSMPMAIALLILTAGLPMVVLAAQQAAGTGLVPESTFLPQPGSERALEAFNGTVVLSESPMTLLPQTLETSAPLARDVALFPAARLSFTTVGNDLVPLTQDVIRVASIGRGRSYWDVIVQPGEVWHETRDGRWSRAAFPFALVNSLENETHNGIATFRYQGSHVSQLSFQISAQTAPFIVATYFSATGTAPATFEKLPTGASDMARKRHARELSNALSISDWPALGKVLGVAPPTLDQGIPPEDLILDGIDYQGTFYLRICQGAAGPLAWCDRRRFGVWSATKSLATSVAMLRLAQVYGPGIFEACIVDYVPELRDAPAWRDVRFGEAISMATGVGAASANAPLDAIEDGYLAGDYMHWYFAPSLHEKLTAISKDSTPLPWGHGKVARYRDQDMFTLGVALDRYLKTKAGNAADIWTLLERDVYAPLGIYQAPVNRTIEPPGHGPGQPIMAWGYFPTIGDMVKLARLYQAHGAWAGHQLLYRPRIDLILDAQHAHGLPAGPTGDGGEIDYFNAFWRQPYRAADGCRRYVPEVRGYGNVTLALFPNGTTGVRVARSLAPVPPNAGLAVELTVGTRCP